MSTPTRPIVSTSRRAASLPTRLLLFGLGVPADLVAHLVPDPPPAGFRLGVDAPAQALQPAGDHFPLGGIGRGESRLPSDRPMFSWQVRHSPQSRAHSAAMNGL